MSRSGMIVLLKEVGINTNEAGEESSMNMTWRWYGEGNDKITLDHIRQVPGVMGIAWSLREKVAGEVWEIQDGSVDDGLYDRALGIKYLQGVWDCLENCKGGKTGAAS